MRIYVLNSLFLGEKELKEYLPYLPKERQIKVEKDLSYEQKQVQMAAGIIIGYILWQYDQGKETGGTEIHILSEEELGEFLKEPKERLNYVLESGEHGKPYFPLHKDFHFNLSHSGHYVVCAVGDEPIGVDIQKIDAKKGRRVADRFFVTEEKEILNQASEAEFERLFCRFWAAKESYLKYLGTGLQGGLSSHAVDLEKKVVTGENGTEKAVLKEFDCLDGYALFVCGPKKME